MRITIHQPEHLPWTGFFHKMSLADVYVLLDTVQFEKNGWQNRNRLVDRAGNVFWVTVPVAMAGHSTKTIREMAIDNRQDWRRKYWGRIEQAYCRHPFFGQYGPPLREIVTRPCERLVDLNSALVGFFREALGINTHILMASELGVRGKQSELLLDVCRALGADVYLSGPSGREYLDRALFETAGVAVEFHDFRPPVYEAAHYVPGLSTLDVLLNHGPRAAQVMGLQGAVRP